MVSVKDRYVITGTNDDHNLQPIPEPGTDQNLDRFMSGSEGTAITEHFQNAKALTSAKRLLDGQWLLLGVLPTDEAFAPITSLENQIKLA